MTRNNAIDYIIEVLTNFNYTDDSRLDRDVIGLQLDTKREKAIRDSCGRNGSIDPIWLQDLGMVNLTKVKYNDDKLLPVCECEFGKVTLPPIVSLRHGFSNKESIGIHTIINVCGTGEFYFRPFARLFQLVGLRDSHPEKRYNYYTKVSNAMYTLPWLPTIRPIVILSRPLDGFVISSENLINGSLVAGTTYTVYDNQIVYELVTYNPGEDFVAVTDTTFTGTGNVQYKDQKRQMTNEDEYPLSGTMIEEILLKILTIDYKLAADQITDFKNNSKDAAVVTNNGE